METCGVQKGVFKTPLSWGVVWLRYKQPSCSMPPDNVQRVTGTIYNRGSSGQSANKIDTAKTHCKYYIQAQEEGETPTSSIVPEDGVQNIQSYIQHGAL